MKFKNLDESHSMPLKGINVFAILETEFANVNDRTRCEFLNKQQTSDPMCEQSRSLVNRLGLYLGIGREIPGLDEVSAQMDQFDVLHFGH